MNVSKVQHLSEIESFCNLKHYRFYHLSFGGK